MKKKQVVLISLFTVFAVSVLLILNFKNSPENKVNELEQSIDTQKETSGYNACMKKVEEKMKKQEDCTAEKIKEKGYNDGLDCIAQYDNSICKDTDRYNAQVNASNDCIPISDQVTNLSNVDCLKLLENNK